MKTSHWKTALLRLNSFGKSCQEEGRCLTGIVSRRGCGGTGSDWAAERAVYLSLNIARATSAPAPSMFQESVELDMAVPTERLLARRLGTGRSVGVAMKPTRLVTI